MESDSTDRRLRQLMGEIAAAAPPPPELGERPIDAHATVASGNRRHVRLAAAAAALLVIALVGVAVNRPSGDPSLSVLSGESTSDTTPSPGQPVGRAAVVVGADGLSLYTIGETSPALESWVVDQIEAELLSDVLGLGDTVAERRRVIAQDGLMVRIALDPELATRASAAFAELSVELDAAAVTVDNATGQIVGATSRNGTSLGLAQPAGSARIAIYAAALESGMTVDSVVDGTGPCEVDLGSGTITIENYGGSTGGSASLLDQATRASRCGEARLEVMLGGDPIKMLGLMTGADVDGAVTNTPSLTAAEQAGAVVSAANGGRLPLLGFVSEVLTADGRSIYRRGQAAQVMSAQAAAGLMDIMVANVERGTGTRAQLSDVQVAGFTGSDPEFRAAWFVGTADGFTTTVWVAQPDNEPMLDVGGRAVMGGSYPAELWARLRHDLPIIGVAAALDPWCPQDAPFQGDRTGDGIADVCLRDPGDQPDPALNSVCQFPDFPFEADTTGDGLIDTCYAHPSQEPDGGTDRVCPPERPVEVDTTGDGAPDACLAGQVQQPDTAIDSGCPPGFPVERDTTGDGVVDTCYGDGLTPDAGD